MRSFVALAALAGIASAHFQLRYPPTIGFEDSKEDTAPCGGFTPDLSKSDLPDFHTEGDAVAVRLSHPQSKWLFRVTTDPTDDKSWEQIYPIVLQSGLGDFCLPQLTVPEKYVGKKGVLSIVSSAVDGLLYQCSSVNFVKGSQKAPSQCTNATLTASFSSDDALSALVGGSGGSGGNATATKSGGSSTTASPSASPTKNAAAAAQVGSGLLAVLGGLLLL